MLSPEEWGTPVVRIERVAHGGHFVGRTDGMVVFVRHALPGEQVRIRVTEVSKKFLRGDVIEVLEPSPDRVEAPCRYSTECGGCDFQHVRPAAQLDLLAAVLNEQLSRIAGFSEPDVRVEPLEPVLGWRSRVDWTIGPDGRPGLLAHRSHTVVPVEECLIAAEGMPRPLSGEPGERHRGVVTSTGQRLLVGERGGEPDAEVLLERVHDREFVVGARGFWQVHPLAATTLVDVVTEWAGVIGGDTVLDLYSGVGLFTSFLADASGPEGVVHAVEGGRDAHAAALMNLGSRQGVVLHRGDVERVLGQKGRLPARADVVVADPPRSGAKNAIGLIVRRRPRTIVHIGCDPAAFARDLAIYAEQGFVVEKIRAFALFPMTHHVESVALLRPGSSGPA